MKRNVVIGILMALALAIVGGFLLMKAESAQTGAAGDKVVAKGHVPNKAQSRKPSKSGYASTRRQVVRTVAKPVLDLDDEDEDDKRTPAEKNLAARIEKALDEESFEEAVACAKEALTCAKTDIRQAMVDTLGWFGAKALPELTPFLADSDEDVRESAQNEWSMALSDIENDGEKIGTVEMAMQVLTDEDVLEDISGEYIGVDEKLAVESLLRIIEAGGNAQGIAKAKETYEFVTGEEFTDRAAAEKWIAEEYQPPAEVN